MVAVVKTGGNALSSPFSSHELAYSWLNTNLERPIDGLQRRNHFGKCLHAAREGAAVRPCHVFVLREFVGHQRRNVSPFLQGKLFARCRDRRVPRARSS